MLLLNRDAHRSNASHSDITVVRTTEIKLCTNLTNSRLSVYGSAILPAFIYIAVLLSLKEKYFVHLINLFISITLCSENMAETLELEIVFDDPEGGKFLTWKVQEKSLVIPFKCNKYGVVKERYPIAPNEQLEIGRLIVKLGKCEHAVTMFGMCADCGTDLTSCVGEKIFLFILRSNVKTRIEEGSSTPLSRASVPMIHGVPELLVTPEVALYHAEEDSKNLLSQKKLALLVDLDLTLIHTSETSDDSDALDVYHYQMEGPNSPWYHTRLRPYARYFLKKINEYFELHIITHGNRKYAEKVVKMLDPNNVLFGDRILSRDECFDPNMKAPNLKALFPGGDDLVCIIDDREDVWNYAENVVRVRPYRFFKHTDDFNAATLAELGNIIETELAKNVAGDEADAGKDEVKVWLEKADEVPTDNDPDNYLVYLFFLLRRIHETFYNVRKLTGNPKKTLSLKTVMNALRENVFKNLRFVFTGLVPADQAITDSIFYYRSKQFGAVVQKEVVVHGGDEALPTTHLIAGKLDTEKVARARKSGSVIIVSPAWFWTCVERWCRVPEKDYQLFFEDYKTTGRQSSTEADNYLINVDCISRKLADEHMVALSSSSNEEEEDLRNGNKRKCALEELSKFRSKFRRLESSDSSDDDDDDDDDSDIDSEDEEIGREIEGLLSENSDESF
ncbi:RNA polymerase II subunit A C-terminal domain phosphatase [Trichinella nativa]|uniref:RNA polymerase II subunit A C-terminal domain phosphatase n=1 Tax=Trichinella nativa TaxID=6335 RepID=A0A0V1KS74_9BILA|nr:RNA polymerase II subunit A C-terminal domain phosphatase [Trichinella nativa]